MYLAEFTAIALAHFVAVASPGPDFALVLRQAVTRGRHAGWWTSAGIAAGILVHVTYCLLGVALLLAGSPWLFNAMKALAALYLFYLGISAIRAARHPVVSGALEATVPPLSPRRLWLAGFLTNGLNPKATLFFLALFTVVISPSTPLLIQAAYGLYLSLATFAWFALLSSVLGLAAVRAWMLKAGVWFERGMGVVLIVLACQLALSLAPA
ncbi:MAG: hypothetical protein RLZZ385_2264 [Pseudomonadota bacterium]